MNMLRILARSEPRHARMRAYAFSSKEPPAELQLWNVGDNPTDYGVHKWTERSVHEVTARYNERGNPLLIDVEHNSANVEGEPSVTGGYARLEIRAGAPWLVFDWSAYAIGQIQTRQRLFLSPEYDVDADTNEITRLYRVSLVADPGTYRARVLASAVDGNAEEKRMDPTLAAILGILNSVADPAAAVDAIKGFVANLPGADDAVTDPPATDPVVADAGGKAEDKPAFAAAGDDGKDKKVEAGAIAASSPSSAKPAADKAEDKPAIAVLAVAPEETEAVKASRAHAQQSENALRDMILMRDGHRLAPSIRQWASAQPLNVVRGLCSAAPEETKPPVRIAATRGAGQGTAAGEVRKGLEGKELEELQRGMGTFRASTPKTPHMNDKGEFVLPTITPSEHRNIRAAAAAKDGK